MSTRNFIFRADDGLHDLAKARAQRDGCDKSEVGRRALRLYLTGDDGVQARGPRVAAARQARVDARNARDERFAAALGAATAEDPAAAASLAALTGFSPDWCRDLLQALDRAGYLEKTRHGRYVPVPGRDIREGVKAVKALAQRGTAKAGPRYRAGGDLARAGRGKPASPAPAVFKPAEA